MNLPKIDRNQISFIMLILFLQVIVDATMLLDVPVARQIIVFAYITVIPGFIFIKLLKMNELDTVETIIFSVGFSIALLMLGGLLINELTPLLGFSGPLSLFPLMLFLNIAVLSASFFAYRRNSCVNFLRGKILSLPPLVLFFFSLPFITFVGTLWVNSFRNNTVLLFLIIIIAFLIIVGVIHEKMLPQRFYPLAVIMIAISLLFHSSLISKYLVPFGSDVNIEYVVFKTTEESAFWSSANGFSGYLGYQRVNALLSVTILPTIYSNLLNIDAAWVFKIFFPLIFSFVPVALYQLWQRYIGHRYALLSTFLFMVQATFYTEMLGLNRQIIAELFFALLLLTILNKKMTIYNKSLCFMIFSIGLITSHYGLAEIFLFFVSFTLISLSIMKLPRRISISMVLFFCVAMFSWYIYTSNSGTFNSLLSYGEYVYSQLGDFFNPASRGETVLRGLGLEAAPSALNMVSRIFAYLTEAFIVVGFFGLITKRAKIKVSMEYLMFSFVAVALLAALILVPGLSTTMNMTRFYHILLFFLAPLCVIGGFVLISFMSKRKEELKVCLLLLIVLVPYFLFQTGFVYEVTRSQSWSLPLSMNGMDAFQLHYSTGYIYAEDVFSAQWMSRNANLKNKLISADMSSLINILGSYSMLYRIGGGVDILSNVTKVPANRIVYLNGLNIHDGILVGTNIIWNTSQFFPTFEGMDKVYTNGNSEVLRNYVPE